MLYVLQEQHFLLQCLLVMCSLKSMCLPSVVLIGCCVSELHGHECPCVVVLQELHCLPNI